MSDWADVVFRLPEDLATSVEQAAVGSSRWGDVVAAVSSFHEQNGDCCPTHWAEQACRWWRDNGCPPQPPRSASCPWGCWRTQLEGTYCPGCDTAFGESWFLNPEKRLQLGLYAREWKHRA